MTDDSGRSRRYRCRIGAPPRRREQRGESAAAMLMILAGCALAVALLFVGARVTVIGCQAGDGTAQCALQSRFLGIVDVERVQVDGVRRATLSLHSTQYRDDDGNARRGHDWRLQLHGETGEALFDRAAGDALSRARIGEFVGRLDERLRRGDDAFLRVWFADLRVLLAGVLLWLACTTVLMALALHQVRRARLLVLLVLLAQAVPLAGLCVQLLRLDAPPSGWPGLIGPERLPALERRE